MADETSDWSDAYPDAAPLIGAPDSAAAPIPSPQQNDLSYKGDVPSITVHPSGVPVQQSSTDDNWADNFPDAAPPEQLQPSAISDTINQPNATADVTKTIAGNVIPNAAANYAANTVSPLATAGSYALQIGTKGGEYLGEGIDELQRMVRGQPTVSQAGYDQQQKDLMNSIRGGIGLQPTDNGDISRLIPTPSSLLNAGANAMNTPLYQPQTEAGRQTETFGNIATGGAGSGVKALPALMGAAGATAGQYGAQQMDAPQSVQFLASLAGGLGGAKLGSTTPSSNSPMENVENQNTAAFLGPKSTVESASPILQKLANGEQVTSDDINAHATNIGEAAKTLGATLTPQFAQSWLSATKGPEPTTPVEITNAQKDPLRAFIEPYEKNGFGENPVSLSDLTSLDKSLGDLAWKERDAFGNISPDGKRILAAQQNLRKMALEASPENGHAIGDTDGIAALNYARQLYAQGFRMADIERVQEKAQNAADAGKDGAQVARNGYLSMLNNGKKTVGWDDNELAALRGATKTGAVGGILNIANSKLVPIIAAGLGHLDMGAGAFGAQMALKGIANRLQQSRTNKLFNTVAGRNLGNQPDYVAMAAAKRNAPPSLQLEAPPIRQPQYGSGTTPEDEPMSSLDIGSQINQGQQRSLPRPKEMTFEDMQRSGRILSNPESTPIAMPSSAISRTYNPNDLNATGDVSVPEVKMDLGAKGPYIANRNVVRSQSDQAVMPKDQYFSQLHASAGEQYNQTLEKEVPFFKNEYATGEKNAIPRKNQRTKKNIGKNIQSNE